MINLIRSPYYLSYAYADADVTGAQIDLYIYSGDQTTGVPATPTISLTHTRPSVDVLNMDIDISNIIRSYLDPKPFINIVSPAHVISTGTDDLKWVKFDITWQSTGTPPANNAGTILASDGYGFYKEGINPNKTGILTDVIRRKVDRKGIILVPFLNDGTYTSYTVNGVGGAITGSTNSNERVKRICVNVAEYTGVNSIVVALKDGSSTFYRYYDIEDECLYPVKNVVYKNRYGAYDTLTMFKKSVQSLGVEKEKFINNYVSGGVYDTQAHQFHDINLHASEMIKCNSGFVKESESDLYKQLMLSDSVYFYQNEGASYTLTPVIVKTSNLEYKTRVNERLINYELDFEIAYNTIQTV